MNSKANERSAEGKVDGDVEFQQSLQDWQQRKMAGAVQAGLTSAYESLRSPRNPPPVWKRADCTLVENNRRSVVGNMNIRAKTPDCRFIVHVEDAQANSLRWLVVATRPTVKSSRSRSALARVNVVNVPEFPPADPSLLHHQLPDQTSLAAQEPIEDIEKRSYA